MTRRAIADLVGLAVLGGCAALIAVARRCYRWSDATPSSSATACRTAAARRESRCWSPADMTN